MPETNKRLGSIELLRIIAMFSIVSGHAIIHGNFTTIPLTLNGCLALLFTQGSRIAVNCFVLITGYFLQPESIPFKKIARVYRQVYFYQVVLLIAMVCCSEVSITFKNLIKAITPFIGSQYWFATTYILLLVVSPFLNIVLNYSTKKQFEVLLGCLFLFWSVCPTFLLGAPGYSNFGWFIWLYCLAGYLRKYSPAFSKQLRLYHGIVIYICILIATILTFVIGYNVAFLRANAQYLFSEMNRVPAVLCALIIFIACLNRKQFRNASVNRVASCVFGVYLLHDNPYIRDFLWKKVFDVQQYINSKVFCFVVVISIMCVFAIGVIVEIIRRKIDRLLCKGINLIAVKLCAKFPVIAGVISIVFS